FGLLSSLALAACESSYDGELVRAIDYRLDRPRVPAVRISRDVIDHTAPLTIDALVVADDAPVAMEVAACGIRDDLPVRVTDASCFNNPDLVTVISDRLPTRWVPPDLSGVECVEP